MNEHIIPEHIIPLTERPFIEIAHNPFKITDTDPYTLTCEGTVTLVDNIMSGLRKQIKYDMDIKPYFEIKKVIFNNPATIVYWNDGTKTVVKCGKDDTYDAEKGLALCFMKKALGNKGNYNNTLKEYIK